MDYVQKTLHLGALPLATQDSRTEYARDERSGLLVLPSASRSATPQRNRPKPQQPGIFAPGHASLLSICQPRALHLTSIAPRAARACLGTVSAPFFFVLPTCSELCPSAGILESRRNDQRPRQPVFPFCRGSTDLVLISGKSQAVLRRTSLDYGSESKWAYYSLGSRSLCLGHSVLPLPCENRRLSMGFCRVIYIFPVRACRRSIWVSVQAYILLVLLQVRMTGDHSLLVVQSSPCSPTKAPLRSSLEQNEPSLTQQRIHTY